MAREEQAFDDAPAQETIAFDIVIVGAGPSGLGAAIRLKQIDPLLSVAIIEKGAAVGAHILSGALIDPLGLDLLLPHWRDDPTCPLQTRVVDDEWFLLNKKESFALPAWMKPHFMSNANAYIGSLGALTKWLAGIAEGMGVDIFTGFAGVELVFGEQGEVTGVSVGDKGLGRDGRKKPGFSRGPALLGKYVFLAEGARGSLTRAAIERFALDKGRSPQKYALGVKEIWQVAKERHKKGSAFHYLGWPLKILNMGSKARKPRADGGGFVYHYGDDLAAVGYSVHLDYENPTLSPFEEMQRFKTHPDICEVLKGARCIGAGARVMSLGGWQAIPKTFFPGGVLLGCAAGFLDFGRLKGVHNALLSGVLAAEDAARAIRAGRSHDELAEYEVSWRASSMGAALYKIRNLKPLISRLGFLGGAGVGGLDLWLHEAFGVSILGTLRHTRSDRQCLLPLSEVKPKAYARKDGTLTFDRLSFLTFSNVAHQEDQPCPLHFADEQAFLKKNLPVYGEPARLYCPADVYEIVYEDEEKRIRPRLVINAANCLHCKTCDLKDPADNICWTPPEGGGGPNYVEM